MLTLNAIVIFNYDKSKILMCKRLKDPYKDLLNFVGGKVNINENNLEAAYRELYEETNISKKDVKLKHLMDFVYHLANEKIEIYVGRLNKEIDVFGDENPLYWLDLNYDFFDKNKFAGDGNIGHILEHVYFHKKFLLTI